MNEQELQDKITELTQELNDVKRQNSALEQTVEDKQAELGAKDTEIKGLKSSIAEMIRVGSVAFQ